MKLASMPRMADFATTVESAAPTLGWAPGEFLEVYAARRVAAIDILLDNDLVASGLEALRELRQPSKKDDALWEGTSDELREAIKLLTPEPKQDKLPKSGKGMIGALRRLAPGLRSKHVDVQLPTGQETSGDRRGQRVIRIVWKGEQPSLPNYPKPNGGVHPHMEAEADSDDAIGARDEEPEGVVGVNETGATDDIPF